MPFHINDWMGELTRRLQDAFGARLAAVGLQGSFNRGEAHEQSDIDAVVILDALSSQDLTVYKNLLAQMPASSHPACGFISGREDLKNWPRAELFQFSFDTKTLYGSFEDILPKPSRKDALEAAQTGAGTLFHSLCHTQVHSTMTPEFLAQLYKGAFFVLQAVHFARSGRYLSSKTDLLRELEGMDAEILNILLEGNFPAGADEKLLAWTQRVLAYTAEELNSFSLQ
ncbi:MAG: nucleotidyltransferase domain-containing protein [Candidatus Avelusimicrobium sp.]|uniref:nucleotidyltransferase domain-containing protein n=1 Tax=Candidatus Avelusimicrobium sp. TaxID=3048833 RepID=UPI003F02E3E8